MKVKLSCNDLKKLAEGYPPETINKKWDNATIIGVLASWVLDDLMNQKMEFEDETVYSKLDGATGIG